jgi:hypothetical protein
VSVVIRGSPKSVFSSIDSNTTSYASLIRGLAFLNFRLSRITTLGMIEPLPIPGHSHDSRDQSSLLSRTPCQNGYVEHCIGRASYTVHPSLLHNIQSLLGFSRKLSQNPAPVSTFLTYACRNSCNARPLNLSRFCKSRAHKNTKPGSWRQQAEHCVHSNRKPSCQNVEFIMFPSSERGPPKGGPRVMEREGFEPSKA